MSTPASDPVQRRTVTLLVTTQVIGAVGVSIGVSVGALLTARVAGGPSMSGIAASAMVIGGALLAIPVTRLMHARGRRPGLVLAYLVGALGAVVVIAGAVAESVPAILSGTLLFGGGTAANLQARYTAVDLAAPTRRGRQLSLVVWAATIGSVAGPNLSVVADAAVAALHLPPLSGPYVFSAVAFAAAAIVIAALLRPDPLLVARERETAARRPATAPATRIGPHRGGIRGAAVELTRNPAARLGVAAVAVGHAVMVGVMSMTPVHIDATLGPGGHGDLLRVVGLVLSAHIAGMYALSPVVGFAADRFGRRPVMGTGVLLLVAACALAGTAGHSTPQLTVGLMLLGVGWSCTMVAGSTMLSESVSVSARPALQGLGDFIMGIAGAAAGALSGVIVELAGYPVLALVAALITVPLTAAVLRTRRPAEAAAASDDLAGSVATTVAGNKDDSKRT